MNTDDVAKVIVAVIVFVFVLALLPLAFIWGWNQLFGSLHAIEYTFWNWLAVIAIGSFFNLRVNKTK